MAEPQPGPDKTLYSLSSSTDHPHPASSTEPGSGSELLPPRAVSLERTVSSSKLNAKALEFVPNKPPPGARIADPRLVISPPPPSPPIAGSGMVHVYGPPPSPPFHVPISPPPPNPLHHPHIPPQQQQQVHLPHLHSHPLSAQPQNHNQKQLVGGSSEQVVTGPSHQDPTDKDQQPSDASKHGLSDEAFQKIINQVEFYFSDVNLATTDHLIRFINKDPEGYVPMSVVASFKKIKALVSSNTRLAAVLRSSTKLVVSEDGKKVKRLNSLTASDMDELQCRIIVAENLPEDHCYQNLMKIFSAVGSVKSIRTCQPQTQNANSGASSASRPSKTENMLYCNKVHAFVEYDTTELAEKAVAELNGEGDWRNGLRVRLLSKRSSKSQQTRAKRAGSEGEVTNEEESTSTSDQIQNDKQAEEGFVQTEIHSHEEEQGNDKEGSQKKGRNRSRGKGRGRGGVGGQNLQTHQNNNRGQHHIGSPPTNLTLNNNEQQHTAVARQPPPPWPRMPDGTRGFSMGRGKPVTVNTAY